MYSLSLEATVALAGGGGREICTCTWKYGVGLRCAGIVFRTLDVPRKVCRLAGDLWRGAAFFNVIIMHLSLSVWENLTLDVIFFLFLEMKLYL